MMRKSDSDSPTHALSVALHTAARRYCIEREAHWQSAYSLMQRGREHRYPYTYSDADYAVFPRYNVLRAILLDVQRVVPDEMPLETCRELLVLAGQTAETNFTVGPCNDIAARAMQEERDAFCAHVGSLDDDLLWRVAPLPHCRVLSEQDTRKLVEGLNKHWGVGSDWYPISPTARPDVEAFWREPFENSKAGEIVRSILRAQGVSRVLYLNDNRVASEIDTGSLDIAAASAEEFWTTPAHDWLIYVSHESTVTIGGSLLQTLQHEWDGWLAARWTCW
jgi:hypothetical protein